MNKNKKLEKILISCFSVLMKAIKFLLSVMSVFAFATALTAQVKDPVIVEGSGKSIVDIKPFKDPVDNSKEWRRIEVVLRGIENPDKTATKDEKRWIKDVALELTLVYAKPNSNNKWDPKNWVILKAKSELVAIEVNKKARLVFFLPPEIKDLYRLQDNQRLFYIIGLEALGNKVEINQKNLKKFVSNDLVKRIKNAKQFEKIKTDLAAASTVNEGWLIPLPQAPFHMQYEEYLGKNKPSSGVSIPTYKMKAK